MRRCRSSIAPISFTRARFCSKASRAISSPATPCARYSSASGSSWRDSKIDRGRAAESEGESGAGRAEPGIWHRRRISRIAVRAVARRVAGTESAVAPADTSAAHRHTAAEQHRENRRQHTRRSAVLLILLILSLRLISLRAWRFVVLVILERAGRGVRIGAVGRHRIVQRDTIGSRARLASAGASKLRTDLDPVIDDQRRVLQIVARLLLGVGLAEIARDETKQDHLLATAWAGHNLCANQRQRVMLQIIGESLALRRIDRAAGDGAGSRGRRHRTGIETVGASQRRRFARTSAKRILRRLASGQSRESDRDSENRQSICDASHIWRGV